MKLLNTLSLLGFVSLLSLSQAGAANADVCQQTVGPFWSQYEAYQAVQQAQAQGYQTSNVWGSDGLISNSSNRKYWFNVYYPC
ncbi:MAG: hypothetical protein R3D05_02070 [Dongiaceae bacterium]